MLLRLFFFLKNFNCWFKFFFSTETGTILKLRYHSMKFSRASSRVNILKCSDVSRINSVPIFRVQGSDWWPGILWSSIYTWLGLWRRAERELFLETSEHFNLLTRLLARENFIEFTRRENIKTYYAIIFPWATFFQHPAPSSARVTATCLLVLRNVVSLTWTQNVLTESDILRSKKHTQNKQKDK